MFCTHCGEENAESAKYCYRCGEHIDLPSDFSQTHFTESQYLSVEHEHANTSEGVKVSPSLQFAGFWIRFLALTIDSLFVIIIFTALAFLIVLPFAVNGSLIAHQAILKALERVLYAALIIGYFTLFVARYSATPGKMLLGLRIIWLDGQSPSWKRALGRTLAQGASSLVFCFGYIQAAFRAEKMSPHDELCRTRVVWKRSLPPTRSDPRSLPLRG